MTKTQGNQRLLILQTLLKERQIEAFLISSAVDIQYLTGLELSREEREGFLLATPKESALFIDSRKEDDRLAWLGRKTTLDFTHPIAAALNTAVLDFGLESVTVDERDLSLAEFNKLAQGLNGTKLRLGLSPVAALRLIKDEAELEAVKKAVVLTDKAFEMMVPTIALGQTEREIAWRLEKIMRDQGAERLSFPTIVAVGAGSAVPHYEPGNIKVSKGKNILLDFGCVVDGYCSDITRVIFTGTPTAAQRKQYATVLKAQQAALGALKVGVAGGAVDQLVRRVIKDAGFPVFNHGLGHGVGLAIHELPYLRPDSTDALEPGAVFSIEPGIYLPGAMGVRLEDLVLMTNNGPQILTQASKELIVA